MTIMTFIPQKDRLQHRLVNKAWRKLVSVTYNYQFMVYLLNNLKSEISILNIAIH